MTLVAAEQSSTVPQSPDPATASPVPAKPVHYLRLDVLRALAALAVFGFHARLKWLTAIGQPSAGAVVHAGSPPRSFWLTASSLLQFGQLGVTLFFVLSGFCIHLSIRQARDRHRRPLVLKEYALRRFFRIWPVYLLVLGLIVLRSIASHDTQGLAGDVLAHAFMVHNFSPNYFFNLNPSLWSLANEVQFYLLYPILFLPLARGLGWGGLVAAALLVSVGLQGVLMRCHMADVEASKFYYFSVPVTAFEWLLGAWVADRLHRQVAAIPGLWITATAGLIGFFLCWRFAPPLFLNGTLAAFFFAEIVGVYGVRKTPRSLASNAFSFPSV